MFVPQGVAKNVPSLLASIIINKFYVELRELESSYIFKSSLTVFSIQIPCPFYFLDTLLWCHVSYFKVWKIKAE